MTLNEAARTYGAALAQEHCLVRDHREAQERAEALYLEIEKARSVTNAARRTVLAIAAKGPPEEWDRNWLDPNMPLEHP